MSLRGSPASVLYLLLRTLAICCEAPERDGDGTAPLEGASKVG